jgi:ABC-type Fe3+ transport system substrate-binding protein
MGQDKGMTYLRRFAEQKPVSIPAAQRVVLDKVISGEFPLSVMILNYHATISQAQGAPVTWLHMEPLLQTMGLISVVKDAPHPNAARLLVEFMLSDEGQKVFADNDYIPASPTVPAKEPTNKPDAGKFKVNVIMPDEIRESLPQWTALYQEMFR